MPPSNRITLTESRLDQLLEAAALRGAKLALASVGLEDDDAPKDVRTFRAFLQVARAVGTGFFTKLGAVVAVGALALIGILLAKVGLGAVGGHH